MTDKHRTRIEAITWKRHAEALRTKLLPLLRKHGVGETFLEQDATRRFGAAFWAHVESLEEESVENIPGHLLELDSRFSESAIVVWLHRHSNTTGAIRTSGKNAKAIRVLCQEELGPDILIASEDLAHGFCLERGESEEILRQW